MSPARDADANRDDSRDGRLQPAPATAAADPTGTDWSDSDAPTDENLSPYGDDMNCNAGGAGSLVVAFALLGVVARRRQR